MNDLEQLGLVLVGVYLVECLVFIRTNTALLRRTLRGKWTVVHASGTVGNQKGGLVWVSPLPYFPSSFTLAAPPVSLSQEGVLAWTSLSIHPSSRGFQTGRWQSWETLQTLHVDRLGVRINGTAFLTARSPQEAQRIHALMDTLRGTNATDRNRTIEDWVRNTLSTEQVNKRLQSLNKTLRPLIAQSWVLFATIFVIAPTLIWFYGLSRVGWALLGVIYLQSLAMAWRVWRTHRRLYPEAGDERFVRVLTCCLAPLSAIRCPELLLRPALGESHPLAIVRVLASEKEFRGFAAECLRDLHSPIEPRFPSAPTAARPCEEAWRSLWTAEIERFLTKEGFSVPQALQAPIRSEASHKAYCPRCQMQFTSVDAQCMDCGRKSLTPFALGTRAT